MKKLTKNVTICLDREIYQFIKNLAKEKKTSMAHQIRKAVDCYLQNRNLII